MSSVTQPAPETGAARPVETTIYGAGGGWVQKIRPNLSVTQREYYLTGNLKREWGAGVYEQSLTYDAAGRMKTLTAGTGTTTWYHDPQRGWLNGKTYADGKGTSYTYWASGRMHTRRWARNITTTYAYNNAGEMESVDYSDTTPDVSLAYDRAGRISTESNDTAGALFSYLCAAELRS